MRLSRRRYSHFGYMHYQAAYDYAEKADPMTKYFYVELDLDLLGVYLQFEAENIEAVDIYMADQYLREGIWRIPWRSLSERPPDPSLLSRCIFIKATCGYLR